MARSPASPLAKDKQVDILLFEYDSLRQEQVAAVNGTQTLVNVLVVTLVAALGAILQSDNRVLYVAVPTVIVVFLYVYLNLQWVIYFTGTYMKVLATRVNAIAQRPLLRWLAETKGDYFYSKLVLTGPQNRTRGLNYYPFTSGALFLGLVSLFAYALIQGADFMIGQWGVSQTVARTWALGHLALALTAALLRALALPRFLAAYEDYVTAETPNTSSR